MTMHSLNIIDIVLEKLKNKRYNKQVCKLDEKNI